MVQYFSLRNYKEVVLIFCRYSNQTLPFILTKYPYDWNGVHSDIVIDGAWSCLSGVGGIAWVASTAGVLIYCFYTLISSSVFRKTTWERWLGSQHSTMPSREAGRKFL